MDLQTADERPLLERMLDRQREEVAGLLDGLDEAAARARLVPSLTTPLGLVTHATFVEQVWFHHRVDGRSREELGIPRTVDASFRLATTDTVESVRAAYAEACERSRQIAAQHELDERFDWYGNPVSLRFVYVHMVAELARHAGHGDILVEQLADGAVSR
ncbi:MAG: DinB family protein [Nocardioides sp.]|uniref:DinB family protein n=1 Tax=Nocardioides sp. TaxID=35761 RepID=UPI003EFCFF80